jgi:hypothetical protein
MIRPVATAVAAALIAATLLTGCGRGAARDDVPAGPSGTTQETPAPGLDSIDDELAAVDDALAQSQEDAGAGDGAAATDDQP